MSGHTVSKGSGYRTWRSSLSHPDCTKNRDTRQNKRDWLLNETWAKFSGENVTVDEVGIIPRKVRRDMAIGRFHKLWEKRNA